MMNFGVEVSTRILGASSDEASSQPASPATSSIELATTKAPAKKWQVSVFMVQCTDMF
jgi:hypothetical protein